MSNGGTQGSPTGGGGEEERQEEGLPADDHGKQRKALERTGVFRKKLARP